MRGLGNRERRGGARALRLVLYTDAVQSQNVLGAERQVRRLQQGASESDRNAPAALMDGSVEAGDTFRAAGLALGQ